MSFYTEKELEDMYQKIVASTKITYNVLKEFEELKPPILDKPSRPRLDNRHNLREVKEYSKLLEKYEEDLKDYNANYKDYLAKNNDIDNLKVRYIKEVSGLLTIPKQYQDNVYNLAYKYGHSGGHHEVLNYLFDMIEIFKNNEL